MQAKQSWYAFTMSAENRNKPYTVNGQQMTLDQAEKAGLTSERANILGQMKAEFFKPYANYDLAFAEKYMFPGMKEVDAANEAAYGAKLQQQFEVDERNRRLNDISTQILNADKLDRSGAERIIRMNSAGNNKLRGLAREQLMADLTYLAENGRLKDSDLTKLYNQEITINGKTTTFGEQYLSGNGLNTATGIAYSNIQKLIQDKDLAERQRKRQITQEKANEWTNKLVVFAAGRKKFTIAERQQLQKQWQDNFKGLQMPERVKNILSNQASELEQSIQFDQARNDLSIDNLADIRMRYPDLSSDQEAIVARLNGINMKEGDAGYGTKLGTNIVKESVSRIENAAATKMKTVDTDANQYKVKEFMDVVSPMFQRELQARIYDPKYKGMSEADIASRLVQEYTDAIRTGKEGTVFQIEGTGDAAYFPNISGRNESRTNLTGPIYQGIRDGTLDPYTQPIFGKDSSSQLVQDLLLVGEMGEPNEWLREMSRELGIPWKTLYNTQAGFYGLDPLTPLRHEAAQEYIGEDVKGFLGRNASPITLQQALSQQQRVNGATGLEVYRPLLDLIASEESSNDTVHRGYDAMNLGGTNGGYTPIGTTTGTKHFQGQPLMNFTLGEIIELGLEGKIHAAGRYQFTPIAFADMQQRGWMPAGISLDSPFDENTQDLLAIAYFRQSIQDFTDTNQKCCLWSWSAMDWSKQNHQIKLHVLSNKFKMIQGIKHLDSNHMK